MEKILVLIFLIVLAFLVVYTGRVSGGYINERDTTLAERAIESELEKKFKQTGDAEFLRNVVEFKTLAKNEFQKRGIPVTETLNFWNEFDSEPVDIKNEVYNQLLKKNLIADVDDGTVDMEKVKNVILGKRVDNIEISGKSLYEGKKNFNMRFYNPITKNYEGSDSIEMNNYTKNYVYKHEKPGEQRIIATYNTEEEAYQAFVNLIREKFRKI